MVTGAEPVPAAAEEAGVGAAEVSSVELEPGDGTGIALVGTGIGAADVMTIAVLVGTSG